MIFSLVIHLIDSSMYQHCSTHAVDESILYILIPEEGSHPWISIGLKGGFSLKNDS